MFYAVEDVWPLLLVFLLVLLLMWFSMLILFLCCEIKLSSICCSPVTHGTYSSELPYFTLRKPLLLQLAIKAKCFFLHSISSRWIKIYFITATYMYTLMLKAAVHSNKSVETFVMGTLLDSLIGGGQISGIKGMSPGSATQLFPILPLRSPFSPFSPLRSPVSG